MDSRVSVRRISEGDWDSIVTLEASAYESSGLSEGPAVLKSRASASPATCLALEVSRRIAGYVLALPYPQFEYPDLSQPEEPGARSCPPGNLHLHDLVIADGFRRCGLGQRLLRHLTATAASSRYERISLIAVGGSDTFWSGNGYRAHCDIALPQSYGANAVYMSKTIEPGRRLDRQR